MKRASKKGAPSVGRVLVGDCAAIMKDPPAGSIDLVFADPPCNLLFGQHPAKATLLAVGQGRSGRLVSSIRAVGPDLMGGVPADAWELWSNKARRGTSRPIDVLRGKLEPKALALLAEPCTQGRLPSRAGRG